MTSKEAWLSALSRAPIGLTYVYEVDPDEAYNCLVSCGGQYLNGEFRNRLAVVNYLNEIMTDDQLFAISCCAYGYTPDVFYSSPIGLHRRIVATYLLLKENSVSHVIVKDRRKVGIVEINE